MDPSFPTYFISELRKNRKKRWDGDGLYLLLFLAILLGFLLLLLLRKTQLEISITIEHGKNISFLALRMLKFIRIRVNLPLFLHKTDSDRIKSLLSEDHLKKIKKVMRLQKEAKLPLNYIKSGIEMDRLTVCTRFGTGDAAVTAWLSGGLYSAFALIIPYLKNYYHLKKQKLQIVPYYQGRMFDLDLDCIIQFKISHIIIAGFKMLKQEFQKRAGR